jgi:hypothetical protein
MPHCFIILKDQRFGHIESRFGTKMFYFAFVGVAKYVKL